MTAPAPIWPPDATTLHGRILTIHPDGRVVDRLRVLHPIGGDGGADHRDRSGLRGVALPHGGMRMWLCDVAMLGRTDPNLPATAIAHRCGWDGGKVYGPALFTGTRHPSGASASPSDRDLDRLHADAIGLAAILELPGAAANDADRVDPVGRTGIEM